MTNQDQIEALIARVRTARAIGVALDEIVEEICGAGDADAGEVYLAWHAACVLDPFEE